LRLRRNVLTIEGADIRGAQYERYERARMLPLLGVPMELRQMIPLSYII
jgi:hypothetical protein